DSALMNLLMNVLGQDPSKEGDLWSKVLGIDRIQIPEHAEWSITWQHMPPLWVLLLLVIPAILVAVGMVYRRERQDVGAGPKVVLTVFRALLLLLTLLLLMGPVLTVETIKKRKAFIIVMRS